MKRKEVDGALEEARQIHERIVGYRIPDECWGWGAVTTANRRSEVCVDCGGWASLKFEDGAVRCHRCAMWRHFGTCPYLKEVEDGKGDVRGGTGHSQVSAPAM